jgi:cytochrome c6
MFINSNEISKREALSYFRNALKFQNCILIHVSDIMQINTVASSRKTSVISVPPSSLPLPPRPHPPTFQFSTLLQESARWATGLAIAASIITHPSLAMADQASAEQTFASTCAGCHAGGGNIVRREATLKLEDLTKYGVDSVDELYNVIYSGKGSMPGYGEGCTPKGACTFGRRLSENDVRDLAEYVLKQAKAGWE